MSLEYRRIVKWLRHWVFIPKTGVRLSVRRPTTSKMSFIIKTFSQSSTVCGLRGGGGMRPKPPICGSRLISKRQACFCLEQCGCNSYLPQNSGNIRIDPTIELRVISICRNPTYIGQQHSRQCRELLTPRSQVQVLSSQPGHRVLTAKQRAQLNHFYDCFDAVYKR